MKQLVLVGGAALSLMACGTDGLIDDLVTVPPIPGLTGGSTAGTTGSTAGSTGGTSAGTTGGSTATNGGTTATTATTTGGMMDAGPDSAVDAGDDAGEPPAANVDPNDPPVATAPCGTDLDVANGTVLPQFGVVPAGGAFAGDPGADGPHEVTTETAALTNPNAAYGDINVTVYAPSSGGTLLDGPLPLVIVLPGFTSAHTGYTHFSNHFASHGFVALGVSPTNWGFTSASDNPGNVQEVLTALDWAINTSSVAGKIDVDKIAAGGHSEGGKIAFFTAATDERIKIVLGWDQQNGGGPPCGIPAVFGGGECNSWPVAASCPPQDQQDSGSAPSSGELIKMRAESVTFAARDDGITPDTHLRAEHFYRAAPSPAHMLLFPNAGHGDWGAAGDVTTTTKRVHMALLLTRFMGMTGLDGWLPGGSDLAGVADVQVFTK